MSEQFETHEAANAEAARLEQMARECPSLSDNLTAKAKRIRDNAPPPPPPPSGDGLTGAGKAGAATPARPQHPLEALSEAEKPKRPASWGKAKIFGF